MKSNVVIATTEELVEWLTQQGCIGLSADSRRIQSGEAFFAWAGAKADARDLVPSFLDAGTVCVADAGAGGPALEAHSKLAVFPDLKARAGEVADLFYGRASEQMAIVAVTGTNGKTSTAWWLSQALGSLAKDDRAFLSEWADHRTGEGSVAFGATSLLGLKENLGDSIGSLMVGTLGFGQPPKVKSSSLTTPDSLSLHEHVAVARKLGARSVVLEASSIGIVEHRLAGLRIHVAIFTNFSQDHLDYHGTMSAYWAAKRSLFDWPSLRAAVINLDDTRGEQLCAELRLTRPELDLWPFSSNEQPHARLWASDITNLPNGMRFKVNERSAMTQSSQSAVVTTSAFGAFNIQNLLGVIAAQRALGASLELAAKSIGPLLSVPGRLEAVGCSRDLKRPLVLVDYAHTPDALEQALRALRPVATARGGALTCIFGCGGDRDRSKRPLMASTAERLADHVVLTQDNPRMEAMQQIEADVLLGFSRPMEVTVLRDRRVAIQSSIQGARSVDVVLVAGKGHEEYQEVEGVRYAFSDQEVASQSLSVRGDAA